MDRGWQVRPEARGHIERPPSACLNRFWHDTITHSEEALRYITEPVGVGRVVFGADGPCGMCTDWPVSWTLGLKSLTQDEKKMILWRTLNRSSETSLRSLPGP